MEKHILDKMVNDVKFKRLEGLLQQPNIFSILSIEGMEIRHSNFFAWLLDPNESHGLGDKVLREFLTKISGDKKAKFNINMDKVFLDKVRICREFPYDGESEGEDNDDGKSKRQRSYIDILIIHDQFVVTVENKTGTTDHADQLYNYRKAIEKKYQDDSVTQVFVYMSPYGYDPNDERERDSWINYSYESLVESIAKILFVEEYSQSLNRKASDYIKDYITIIRRNYNMKNDDANKLAAEIYKAHKKAIDLLIEYHNQETADLNDKLEKIYIDILDELWKKGKIIFNKESEKGSYLNFYTEKMNGFFPKNSEVSGSWGDGCKYRYWISNSKKPIIKFELGPKKQDEDTIQKMNKILDILKKKIVSAEVDEKRTANTWNQNIDYSGVPFDDIDEASIKTSIAKAIDELLKWESETLSKLS